MHRTARVFLLLLSALLLAAIGVAATSRQFSEAAAGNEATATLGDNADVAASERRLLQQAANFKGELGALQPFCHAVAASY
jgi:hypothetical protein